METWLTTAERSARSAQSAHNERSAAKSNSTTNSRYSGSGSSGSQGKKRKLGLTLKSSYLPGSEEEEFEDGDVEERDQAQDREVIDLVTPSPPPALAALQSSSSSNTASGTSSEQQTTQRTSLNTREFSGNNSSSTSSQRPKKKAKLVLRASYVPSTSPSNTSDSEDNILRNANFDALYTAYGPSLRPSHPNFTSTHTADEEDLDYFFNAGFDRRTDEDEDADAEGTYESSPPLDNTPYATALSVEKHPQVFEIADMVHACNGCCLTQDVVVPSIERPGAVDRQGAVHELVEYLFDAAYGGKQPGEYVKWEVEIFSHDNTCCETPDGTDDCGDLTGTLDISSTRSVHIGTLASVFPDWENPERRNEEREYLFKRRSAWMEVYLRASMEEVRWMEAEDGGKVMVVPEGEEGFELAKQKARAALMGWVKEESEGVVVFIDGRDVKVFVKFGENGLKRKRGDTDEEDSDDEIEEMSPVEFKRAEEEKAAGEKKKQMDEIHAHMRDYEARMKPVWWIRRASHSLTATENR